MIRYFQLYFEMQSKLLNYRIIYKSIYNVKQLTRMTNNWVMIRINNGFISGFYMVILQKKTCIEMSWIIWRACTHHCFSIKYDFKKERLVCWVNMKISFECFNKLFYKFRYTGENLCFLFVQHYLISYILCNYSKEETEQNI